MEKKEEKDEANEQKTYELNETELKSLSLSQLRALVAVRRGKNVFITGPGGKGKSFVLKKFMLPYLYAKFGEDAVALTSSTGKSAVDIGGLTLHSYFGLHSDMMLPSCDHIPARPRIWPELKVLVVDEVSMVSGPFLELVERQAHVSGVSFLKQIQVILLGDFLQLPPIENNTTITHSTSVPFDVNEPVDESAPEVNFAFKSRLWKKLFDGVNGLEILLAEQSFRQLDDPVFSRLLDDLRVGRCSKEQEALIQSTQYNFKPQRKTKQNNKKKRKRDEQEEQKEEEEPDIKKQKSSSTFSTRLYATKKDVSALNVRQLQMLPAEECFEFKTHMRAKKQKGGKYTEKEQEILFQKVQKTLPVQPNTFLKIGARVMLVVNLDVGGQLANGSVGHIVEFVPDEDDATLYPLVEFENNRTAIITSHEWNIKVQDGVVTVTGLPLILAWAITMHKSQGQTISPLTVDAKDIFEAGQFYVAISRGKSLSQICIKHFDASAVMVNREAKKYYKRLAKRPPSYLLSEIDTEIERCKRDLLCL